MECISKNKFLNRPEYFDNKLSKKPFCTVLKLRLRTLTFSVTSLLKICSDEKHSLKYLDGIYVCKSNNVGAESKKKLLWEQMMRPANKTKICFKGQDLQLLKLEALARLTIKLGSLIFICPTRYTSSFHRKSWIWHFTLQQLFEYLLWKVEFWETKNELFLWIVSMMEKQQTKPSIY